MPRIACAVVAGVALAAAYVLFDGGLGRLRHAHAAGIVEEHGIERLELLRTDAVVVLTECRLEGTGLLAQQLEHLVPLGNRQVREAIGPIEDQQLARLFRPTGGLPGNSSRSFSTSAAGTSGQGRSPLGSLPILSAAKPNCPTHTAASSKAQQMIRFIFILSKLPTVDIGRARLRPSRNPVPATVARLGRSLALPLKEIPLARHINARDRNGVVAVGVLLHRGHGFPRQVLRETA